MTMKTLDQKIKEEDLWELQKEVAKLKGQISALTDELRVRQKAYDELFQFTERRAEELHKRIVELEERLKVAIPPPPISEPR
jgi:predicted  nucleic acid-binding Zn-ribbon protein